MPALRIFSPFTEASEGIGISFSEAYKASLPVAIMLLFIRALTLTVVILVTLAIEGLRAKRGRRLQARGLGHRVLIGAGVRRDVETFDALFVKNGFVIGGY